MISDVPLFFGDIARAYLNVIHAIRACFAKASIKTYLILFWHSFNLMSSDSFSWIILSLTLFLSLSLFHSFSLSLSLTHTHTHTFVRT